MDTEDATMATAPLEGRSALSAGKFRRYLARASEQLYEALAEAGAAPGVSLAELRRAVREEAEALVREWQAKRRSET